jgi:hypothetical protein
MPVPIPDVLTISRAVALEIDSRLEVLAAASAKGPDRVELILRVEGATTKTVVNVRRSNGRVLELDLRTKLLEALARHLTK